MLLKVGSTNKKEYETQRERSTLCGKSSALHAGSPSGLHVSIELVDRRCAAVLVLAYIRGQFICQTVPEIEMNNLLLLVGSTVAS